MDGGTIKQYSLLLEQDLRNLYKCESSGLGGTVNSNNIRCGGFIQAITMAFAKNYENIGKKDEIDKFIDEIQCYLGVNMDELGLDIVEKIMNRYEELTK